MTFVQSIASVVGSLRREFVASTRDQKENISDTEELKMPHVVNPLRFNGDSGCLTV